MSRMIIVENCLKCPMRRVENKNEQKSHYCRGIRGSDGYRTIDLEIVQNRTFAPFCPLDEQKDTMVEIRERKHET